MKISRWTWFFKGGHYLKEILILNSFSFEEKYLRFTSLKPVLALMFFPVSMGKILILLFFYIVASTLKFAEDKFEKNFKRKFESFFLRINFFLGLQICSWWYMYCKVLFCHSLISHWILYPWTWNSTTCITIALLILLFSTCLAPLKAGTTCR